MDIISEAQIILRDAGYDTWAWSSEVGEAACFEDDTLAGFIHIFTSAERLLGSWEQVQRAALTRYAPVLKTAGEKAWNIYSVFLTPDSPPSSAVDREVERIDEIFQHTRKVARTGILTERDLRNALLPLLPITSRPLIAAVDYKDRLLRRASDLPSNAVAAFIGEGAPADVAVMLGEVS